MATVNNLQIHERSLLSIEAFRSFFPQKIVNGEPVFITARTVRNWAARGWIRIRWLKSGRPVIEQKYVRAMLERGR